MSNMDSGPYEEGRIAASEGVRISGNPYDKGTDEYDLWREGHNDQDGEASDGEDEDDD